MAVPAFICLTCGYDISTSPLSPCPECGRVHAEGEQPQMAESAAIFAQGDRIPRRHVVAWLLVVFIYAVGAEFMKDTDEMPALIIAPILLGLVCAGSFAAGSVALLGLFLPTRLAAQHAWRRELWALHLPWLLMAPASVVLLVGTFLLGKAGQPFEVTLWFSGAVGAVWLLCSLATPFYFMRRVRRRLQAAGADARSVRFRLWLAALAVLPVAMFMGLGGGLLARYGSATMGGYPDPPSNGP